MGAGIAKQIKQRFPQAFEADKIAKDNNQHDLGNYSAARVLLDDGSALVIVNAYIQESISRTEKMLDESALQSVFEKVKVNFAGAHIAYPAIGAGLSGGDWSTNKQIIDQALKGENHTYVEFASEPV